MVVSGCTVGAPIVSLCLQAGWSLGGVKDKYLFCKDAGDQYVGRCASGHDVNSKEFVISPTYFDMTHLNTSERIGMWTKINTHLKDRLPGWSQMSEKTWHLVRYCFAAVCYKYNWLHENLHDDCPL